MKKKKIEPIDEELVKKYFAIDLTHGALITCMQLVYKLNEVISLLNDDDKRKRKEDKSSVQIPHN